MSCTTLANGSRRGFPGATLLLMLLMAAGASGLSAQEALPAADTLTLAERTVTLVGVVRDTTGRALSGAEVRAGADAFTLTDQSGRFEISGVEGDTVQLLVRRIGYLPADVILEAAPGLRVELAVSMVPAAVQLGTVVIEGRQMDTRLWRNGFYEREKSSFGYAFGPDEVDGKPIPVSALAVQAPGVHLVHGAAGKAIPYGRIGSRQCALNIFLDGMHIRWASEVGIDQLVNRQEVIAVEVYPRATSVPTAFLRDAVGLPSPGGAVGGSGAATDCGVLLIWTRPLGEKG